MGLKLNSSAPDSVKRLSWELVSDPHLHLDDLSGFSCLQSREILIRSDVQQTIKR